MPVKVSACSRAFYFLLLENEIRRKWPAPGLRFLARAQVAWGGSSADPICNGKASLALGLMQLLSRPQQKLR